MTSPILSKRIIHIILVIPNFIIDDIGKINVWENKINSPELYEKLVKQIGR